MLLRHIGQAGGQQRGGRQGGDVAPLQHDRARALRHEIVDGFQQRGLARAVLADQCHDLARLYGQIDAGNDQRAAIARTQAAHRQHFAHPR